MVVLRSVGSGINHWVRGEELSVSWLVRCHVPRRMSRLMRIRMRI